MLRTDLIGPEDGKNRAVDAFLEQWQRPGQTVGDMRDHLRQSGWDSCWPMFVTMAPDREPLTKAGAQTWLRYLFDMEKATTSTAPVKETSATVDTPEFVKILIKLLESHQQDANEEYQATRARMIEHISTWSNQRVDAAKRAAIQFAAGIADAERALFIKQAGDNNGRESDFAFGSVNSAERIAAAIRVFDDSLTPDGAKHDTPAT